MPHLKEGRDDVKFKPGDRIRFRDSNEFGEIVKFVYKNSEGNIYITKWDMANKSLIYYYAENQLVLMQDPNDLMKEIL